MRSNLSQKLLALSMMVGFSDVASSVTHSEKIYSARTRSSNAYGYAGLSKPKTSHAALKRQAKRRQAIRAKSPK